MSKSQQSIRWSKQAWSKVPRIAKSSAGTTSLAITWGKRLNLRHCQFLNSGLQAPSVKTIQLSPKGLASCDRRRLQNSVSEKKKALNGCIWAFLAWVFHTEPSNVLSLLRLPTYQKHALQKDQSTSQSLGLHPTSRLPKMSLSLATSLARRSSVCLMDTALFWPSILNFPRNFFPSFAKIRPSKGSAAEESE